MHAYRQERLSYMLQAGPGDPPLYLTWLLWPGGVSQYGGSLVGVFAPFPGHVAMD
jgi:hypothetical protein